MVTFIGSKRCLQFVIPHPVSMDGQGDKCDLGALPTAKTVGIAPVYQIHFQPLPGDYDKLMLTTT